MTGDKMTGFSGAETSGAWESLRRMDDKMGSSLLTDRGIIEIAGPEAENFLNRIVTNSTLAMGPAEARYSALLSPQGKLQFDFLIVALPEGAASGFVLDCPLALAPELAKRLNFFKLRAKVTITDRSAELAVAAFWDGPLPQGLAIIYQDPRAKNLGARAIGPREALAEVAGSNEEAYEAHRLAQGVAKGGLDFPYGDTFVHDANLDLMHGIDFNKGCYVGQEVVARVHHRKSARKRIVKIRFEGPAPSPGSEIVAGETLIGHVGSVSGKQGLAMLRLDRLEEAEASSASLAAGAAKIDVDIPADMRQENAD